MDLSIVIVSYRTPEHLRRCLTGIAAHRSRASREVVVVDNHSGDGSAGIARSFAGAAVIETGDNLGFAGGVNRGLAAARGRYALILNPDIDVHPGSLDALVDFMDAHPQTGLAGPKLLNRDGTLQHSCRRFYTFRAILLRRTFLGKLFPNAQTLRRHLMLDYDHAEARPVDWVAGAAMIVRREALEDVGPLDDRYFLYFEDVDWCTRMQARGWLVQYVPDSVMTHHWQRASAVTGFSARTHLRSGLKFYERWGGLLYVLRRYRGAFTAAALVTVDALSVAAAFLAAFFVRREMAFALQKPVWPLSYYDAFITASVVVFLSVFWAVGLYRRIKEGDWVDVGFRVARGATLGALVVMASTFLLDMRGFSRVMILGSWPLVALFAFLGRRAMEAGFSRVRRERMNLRRVALIGPDPVLDRLETALHADPSLGWEPVRIRGTHPASSEAPEPLLRKLSGERAGDVVVTPASFGAGEEAVFAERVTALRRAGLHVRVTSPFLATLPPRGRMEAAGELSWLSFERPGLRPARASKRLLDLVLASVLGVVGVLPAAVTVGILAAGGRGILEPERVFVGRWKETFRARRFRGGGRLRGYPLLGPVLRGDCSLVGPRPLEPGAEVPGGAAWDRVRENHRPGWVGPWSLGPALSLDEEMQQELRYLEDWSPELDLKLLARAALQRTGGSRGRGSPSEAVRGAAREGAPPRPAPESGHSLGIEVSW
jgi:hypothetical protein